MNPQAVQQAYDRCASFYDASTCLYPLVGFRFNHYRKQAISRLHLQPGDHVVDLGCGTGLNFSIIQEFIGPTGRITGVDFSAGMLDRARERVRRKGWSNVELIQADIREFAIPASASAIFISGALGFLPDPAEAAARWMGELSPGAGIGILDLKFPRRWPRWLFHFFFILSGKPFAVTPDYVRAKPWTALASSLQAARLSEHYGGAVYLLTGQSPASPGN